ncbi:uncharacterized protein N7498_001222 [Penicillium cinerascens]|uniref:Uncharacterized protein n=1 Tax=Penicillium cinerascens TaxID=70096 RepID=A0A9W9TDY6_9EURO|nr:uncharacterized protein N7498_001222 [Penicillium cinerascens]KAJ5219123.1 hypothetical protein N7498_001222 [Penicillium cinerascens]
MSTSGGIQTYTSAPVNSNKEEGTHASTSQPEPATTIESSITATSQPANTSATATAPSYSPIYATAQPEGSAAQAGAAPSLPVPTAGTQPGNISATPTTTFPTATSALSPPPPQPGAVPQTSPPAAHSPVPPPPKAGEAVTPSALAPQPSASFTQSYSYQPSQHSIPNSTSTPYSSVYQTHAGASSSRHQGLPLHSNSGRGGGANDIFQDDEPSLMNTAKSWMQSAGTKLAEVEAEVWKKINNAHDE